MDLDFFTSRLGNQKTLDTDDSGNFLSLNDQILNYRHAYSLKKDKHTQKISNDFEHSILRTLEYLIKAETLYYAINIQLVFSRLNGKDILAYLLKNEFISDKLSPQTFQTISSVFTIPILNKILKEHNLKTSGNKQEHIDRIIENIDLDDINLTEYLGNEYNYIISDKGLEYYRENEYKLIYYDALDSYDFEEYEKYYQTNKDRDVLDIAYEFLDLHEENAIKNKDIHYYNQVLKSKERLISVYKLPVEKAFENNIKIFTYNLNRNKSVTAKLFSPNISALRKNYKTVNEGYEEYLQKIYNKTTYNKQFSYEETLNLLEEVFKGSTMKAIKKMIKNR